MKKTLSSLLAIILSLLFLFQTSLVAFAEDEPEWQDASWTEEEFYDILLENPNNLITPYATGLILSYAIAIKGSGTNLLIAGKTTGNLNVVKCGFTVVTVKRRVKSSGSWVAYKEYKDLYFDDSAYTLTKTISVPTGYQWRVYCTHYAKKSLLSTEKIENASNVVVID